MYNTTNVSYAHNIDHPLTKILLNIENNSQVYIILKPTSSSLIQQPTSEHIITSLHSLNYTRFPRNILTNLINTFYSTHSLHYILEPHSILVLLII